MFDMFIGQTTDNTIQDVVKYKKQLITAPTANMKPQLLVYT